MDNRSKLTIGLVVIVLILLLIVLNRPMSDISKTEQAPVSNANPETSKLDPADVPVDKIVKIVSVSQSKIVYKKLKTDSKEETVTIVAGTKVYKLSTTDKYPKLIETNISDIKTAQIVKLQFDNKGEVLERVTILQSN